LQFAKPELQLTAGQPRLDGGVCDSDEYKAQSALMTFEPADKAISNTAGWLVVVLSLLSNSTLVPAAASIRNPLFGAVPAIQFWTAEVTSITRKLPFTVLGTETLLATASPGVGAFNAVTVVSAQEPFAM